MQTESKTGILGPVFLLPADTSDLIALLAIANKLLTLDQPFMMLTWAPLKALAATSSVHEYKLTYAYAAAVGGPLVTCTYIR